MNLPDLLKALQEFIISHYDLTQINIIIGYVFFNMVAAVAAGLKTGTFDLSKMGEFLYKKLLPYVLIYLAAGLVGTVAGLESMSGLAFVAIMTILTGDLTDSLYQLGLKFVPRGFVKPETLARLPK